jgi:hypothetical protein
MGINLAVFALRAGHHVALAVEDHEPSARRSLVKSAQEMRRWVWRCNRHEGNPGSAISMRLDFMHAKPCCQMVEVACRRRGLFVRESKKILELAKKRQEGIEFPRFSKGMF